MSKLPPGEKVRLDVLLVERGLCSTRSRAQAEILAGRVFINSSNQLKAGTLVSTEEEIELREPSPWVGRGALKLLHALEYFQINAAQRVAVDIGSSTGGFTQVLLAAGAVKVYAVDSGTGQLHWKLRNDERVVVMENTNARYLEAASFQPAPDLAVIDVSFISVSLILPALVSILKRPFDIVCLVKPQFELEPEWISRGGFVRPAYRQRALDKVQACASDLKLSCAPAIESPITGAKSANVEYLLHLVPVNPAPH